MKLPAVVKYLFVLSVVLCLGLVSAYIYLKYFALNPNSNVSVTNKADLEKYLGKETSRQIKIIVEGDFVLTNDCIAEKGYLPYVFCFKDEADNGKIIIYVYPNPEGIKAARTGYPQEALNFSLFSIFERRFNIDPEAKYSVIDIAANPVFKW